MEGVPEVPLSLVRTTLFTAFICVRSLEPLVPHPQQAAAGLAWTLASELEVV